MQLLAPPRKGERPRQFAHLTGFAGGLSPLPAWVRTLKRVRPGVWTKLLINAVHIPLKT
ncbi:hypothetical protein BH11PLA2_BH11PLA2_50420 [soil metagenome]